MPWWGWVIIAGYCVGTPVLMLAAARGEWWAKYHRGLATWVAPDKEWCLTMLPNKVDLALCILIAPLLWWVAGFCWGDATFTLRPPAYQDIRDRLQDIALRELDAADARLDAQWAMSQQRLRGLDDPVLRWAQTPTNVPYDPRKPTPRGPTHDPYKEGWACPYTRACCAGIGRPRAAPEPGCPYREESQA